MIVRHAWLCPEDPYNKNGIRNTNNTGREEYNCIGYAFDVYAGMNIGNWVENSIIMEAARERDYETALANSIITLSEELPEWTYVENYTAETYPQNVSRLLLFVSARTTITPTNLQKMVVGIINGVELKPFSVCRIIEYLIRNGKQELLPFLMIRPSSSSLDHANNVVLK